MNKAILGGLAALALGCGKTKVETVYAEGIVTVEHLTMSHVETIDVAGRHVGSNQWLSKYELSVKVNDVVYEIDVKSNSQLWCGRDAERKIPRELESELNVGDTVRFSLYNLVTRANGEQFRQEIPSWVPWDNYNTLFRTELPVCMISKVKAEEQ